MGHTRCAVLLLVACTRFSANAGAFNGPGKSFRARRTRRPSVCCLFPPPNQVSASRMRWSSAMLLSLRTSAQWCPSFDQTERLWPQSAASFSDFFQTIVYRHLSSCPQLEATLTATWKGHSALSGIRLIGQNCHQRKMVFCQNLQDVRQYVSADHAHSPSTNGHRQICQNHPSTQYVEERVSRSQHPNARGGRARFLCSGGCRQWRLQQCEVAPFRDSGGPHMLPFRECGGASDSADAARTSGSGAYRPNLVTSCFGCRAQKKKKGWNHSHIWNTDDGSK